MDFENKLQLGTGIYTTSEISQILRLPYDLAHIYDLTEDQVKHAIEYCDVA